MRKTTSGVSRHYRVSIVHVKLRLGFMAAVEGAAEDDGFLISYLHNEETNESEFVVFSAASMSAEPLARVKLPRRVPYGFHGLFVSEQQLAQQE